MLRQKLRRLATALLPATLRDSLAREQELHQQVRLLQTALDHTSHGIQVIDSDGRVVAVNRQALELLELPASLMASKPLLRELLVLQRKAGDLDGLPADVLAEIDAGRDITQSETIFHRRRRDGRLLEVQNVPLPNGGAVRTHTDITLREAANAKIAFMARHDTLTGLGNRPLFLDQLGTALQAGAGVALLCLDLDRFKQVNDSLGHLVGDALLRAVARRLLATVHPGDTVTRLGGDEFAVIHAPLLTAGESEALAIALVEAIARPFEIDGHDIAIAANAGIAFALPGAAPSADPDTLLRHAGLALRDAKSDGRDVVRRFDPGMEESALERHALERELRQALAEDTFELHYQPQVDVRTAALSGFEALLRWRHPRRGLVSAGQLIPLAESTGLIGQLGTWVLNRACADAAIWPPEVRVSVNLSPMQFRSPVLVPLVAAALARHGLPPARLELEVTESLLLRDMAATEATLGALRGMGVRIALDNFGTGYASLSYLRRFLFDRLKIDQSFISGVGDRGDADAVVRAVIGLAGSLGLPTVAEGVERPSQLSWLRREGCDLAQGFLFSRARPAREVPAMLAEHRGVLALGM